MCKSRFITVTTVSFNLSKLIQNAGKEVSWHCVALDQNLPYSFFRLRAAGSDGLAPVMIPNEGQVVFVNSSS
jgi:hypothetical protein